MLFGLLLLLECVNLCVCVCAKALRVACRGHGGHGQNRLRASRSTAQLLRSRTQNLPPPVAAETPERLIGRVSEPGGDFLPPLLRKFKDFFFPFLSSRAVRALRFICGHQGAVLHNAVF